MVDRGVEIRRAGRVGANERVPGADSGARIEGCGAGTRTDRGVKLVPVAASASLIATDEHDDALVSPWEAKQLTPMLRERESGGFAWLRKPGRRCEYRLAGTGGDWRSLRSQAKTHADAGALRSNPGLAVDDQWQSPACHAVTGRKTLRLRHAGFWTTGLWLGQTDGGNSILLRPLAPAHYFTLAFSGDGGTLFFSLSDDTNPKSALFRMPAFGGVPERLRDGIAGFALTPDGKSVVFAGHPDRQNDRLFIVGLDGNGSREIASLPPQSGLISDSLSISPVGDLVAFSVVRRDVTGTEDTQDLFTARVGNGEIKQISSQHFTAIDKTAWLADGSGLMMTARERNSLSSVPQYRAYHIALGGGRLRGITSDLSCYSGGLSVVKTSLITIELRQLNNIWVAPASDLAHAKQITFGSFGKYDGLWGLGWTPDGRLIFDSSDIQSQVISVMNADGSNQKQLTARGQVDSALDVSPDGRYIVFHSTRYSGEQTPSACGFDIWRIDIDGGNPKQLTFDKKSFQPQISPDSRFVYYKSWASAVGELHRISIDGGESVTLTDKETSWPKISPDGKYIAALYESDKSRLALLPITLRDVVLITSVN
jgi:Tol biopolymer transport system component